MLRGSKISPHQALDTLQLFVRPRTLELIVVLVVALLVFGPKRLPDLGSSLGRGMREFNEAVTGADRDELANADVPDARQP